MCSLGHFVLQYSIWWRNQIWILLLFTVHVHHSFSLSLFRCVCAHQCSQHLLLRLNSICTLLRLCLDKMCRTKKNRQQIKYVLICSLFHFVAISFVVFIRTKKINNQSEHSFLFVFRRLISRNSYAIIVLLFLSLLAYNFFFSSRHLIVIVSGHTMIS